VQAQQQQHQRQPANQTLRRHNSISQSKHDDEAVSCKYLWSRYAVREAEEAHKFTDGSMKQYDDRIKRIMSLSLMRFSTAT
jgi:hypothetical protein